MFVIVAKFLPLDDVAIKRVEEVLQRTPPFVIGWLIGLFTTSPKEMRFGFGDGAGRNAKYPPIKTARTIIVMIIFFIYFC
jgi:hypothetical protein